MNYPEVTLYVWTNWGDIPGNFEPNLELEDRFYLMGEGGYPIEDSFENHWFTVTKEPIRHKDGSYEFFGIPDKSAYGFKSWDGKTEFNMRVLEADKEIELAEELKPNIKLVRINPPPTSQEVN